MYPIPISSIYFLHFRSCGAYFFRKDHCLSVERIIANRRLLPPISLMPSARGSIVPAGTSNPASLLPAPMSLCLSHHPSSVSETTRCSSGPMFCDPRSCPPPVIIFLNVCPHLVQLHFSDVRPPHQNGLHIFRMIGSALEPSAYGFLIHFQLSRYRAYAHSAGRKLQYFYERSVARSQVECRGLCPVIENDATVFADVFPHGATFRPVCAVGDDVIAACHAIQVAFSVGARNFCERILRTSLTYPIARWGIVFVNI